MRDAATAGDIAAEEDGRILGAATVVGGAGEVVVGEVGVVVPAAGEPALPPPFVAAATVTASFIPPPQ